jgi:heme o synthase
MRPIVRPINSKMTAGGVVRGAAPRTRFAGDLGEACSPATPVAVLSASHCIRDYLALAKPRVVLMIVVTTAVAYSLGSVGRADWIHVLHTLAGTALAAGGTLALNQFMEGDCDALMRRTQDRPIPSGRLMPNDARAFGALMAAIGIGYLAVAAGLLPAALTLITACLYLGVYTPLKRLTPLCTIVGAIPGALPTLVGWAAAQGGLAWGAGILFAILFCWQIPHTLAIARLYREDYAKAGIRVLPVIDPEGSSTEWLTVLGCLALWAVTLIPTYTGLTGWGYFFGALILGAAFFSSAVAHSLRRSRVSARRVVLASVLYLPVLLALMVVDKIG